MKSLLKRAGWLFLAILFVGTGLGVGVVAFWQATHQKSDTSQNQNQAPKLKGTQLTGFTPIAKVDSLQKIDLTPGTGAEVKPGAIVSVQYTGAIASTGTIFESSLDSGQPATLELKSGSLIEGWVQGLVGMKVNGQRRLLIPAALAYGDRQAGNIPPNSDLVFDIILLDTK